jgi:hypothetical protein
MRPTGSHQLSKEEAGPIERSLLSRNLPLPHHTYPACTLSCYGAFVIGCKPDAVSTFFFSLPPASTHSNASVQ